MHISEPVFGAFFLKGSIGLFCCNESWKAGTVAEWSRALVQTIWSGRSRVQIPAGGEIFSTFFRDGELIKLPYCLQFTHVQ